MLAHRRYATCNTGISISAVYVSMCDQRTVETDAAVKSSSPPGVNHLKWTQRHPPESHAAETEKRYQRRTPNRRHEHRAGIPAPADSASKEPSAIVIRRPAPGIVAHPGPAVVVFPNPLAIAIGRPVGVADCRSPD